MAETTRETDLMDSVRAFEEAWREQWAVLHHQVPVHLADEEVEAGEWSSSPGQLHVVAFTYGDDEPGGRAWTLSPRSTACGWNTDAGISGYGLPKEIAQKIALEYNVAMAAANKGRDECRSTEPS